jgi:abortive infection bacteriophage resistance protein
MKDKKLLYEGKALTLDEQIKLLENRGVLVKNAKAAAQHLSCVGFYRLFSYIKPLLTISSRLDFEQAWDLYVFDRKLRLLLIDAIERIEVAFRVSISERMSIQYNSLWYCDPNHFVNIKRHSDFINEVVRFIEKRKHPLIKHYYETYSFPDLPPSWILIECLTFGNWSKVFYNLRNRQDKKVIAQSLGQPFKTVESWIVSLTEVRNICAHHERLWNHIFHYPPKGSPNARHQREKFYQQGYIVIKLLQKISPDSDWKFRLKALFKEHQSIPFSQMGFLQNWQSDPFWNI